MHSDMAIILRNLSEVQRFGIKKLCLLYEYNEYLNKGLKIIITNNDSASSNLRQYFHENILNQ